jgi:sulfite reductase beta subunit-like hemoprotein
LRINLNGCPNGCGQHWVHDIGLRGRRLLRESGSEEGFTIFLGGRLDSNGHIGEAVADISSSQVCQTVQAILDLYLANRVQGERFSDWANRLGGAEIARKLGTSPLPEQPPTNLRNLELAGVFRAAVEETRGIL